MSKQKVPAGLRGTTTEKDLCQASPPWIKGSGEPPARLLCVRRASHSAKKHQDGRGHQWDVIGSARQ